MPLDFLRVTTVLPASAARVYAAWIDAQEHSRMTGGAATVDPKVGGLYSAWDGYIAGKILELVTGERIVQSWRSTEFPAGHPHSRLEVRLRDVDGGCEITIVHSEIPEGQGAQYESGWQGHYFNPMTEYFRRVPELPKPTKARPAKTAAAKKAIAKKAIAKKAIAKKVTAEKKPAKKAIAKKKPAAKAKKTPAKKATAKPSKKGARGTRRTARRAK